MLLAAGGVGFVALATMNAGGYRYGASDQAFYIPVVLQQLTPELYPHDAELIAAQDRLLMFDDWFAPLLQITGASLSSAFLVAYVVTLLLYYGAIVRMGRVFYTSWWAVSALVVGLTMRHRIPDTAVNSFEGYFHPRLLAFGLGLWAVAVFLRGRTWLALGITGSALLVHPTMGLWFAILTGTAALVADRPARPQLLGVVAVGAGLSLWALTGPLSDRLVVMDETWVALLSVKDYLFSAEWPALTWFGNLSMVAVIALIYRDRLSLGLVRPRETGLVVGCVALLLLFLLSVPLASAHIALVVQLQMNRIFWLFDVLGSVYLGWFLVERPVRTGPSWTWLRTTPRPVVVMVVLVLALTRGSYVTVVDPAGRPISDDPTAADDWTLVMAWASTQPVGTHILANPEHAALYGSSVRVASGRDVYLEIVKDVAIAMYSPDIARRVTQRIDELGDFASLSEDRALALAARYDIDYLITEQELGLTETRRTGRFHVYDLSRSSLAEPDD